ncbi:hypothetical protein OnM2_014038, partial [Erysiphe neolycopersici]
MSYTVPESVNTSSSSSFQSLVSVDKFEINSPEKMSGNDTTMQDRFSKESSQSTINDLHEAIPFLTQQQLEQVLQFIQQQKQEATLQPLQPASQPVHTTVITRKETSWPSWDGNRESYSDYRFKLEIKVEEDGQLFSSSRAVCLGMMESLPEGKRHK